MIIPIRHYLIIPALCAGLVGCSLGPKYETPDLDLPCEWHSKTSSEMTFEDCDNVVWWENLQDPMLDALIQAAAEQNLDLYIASTRILEARAATKGKRAEMLPHIDGDVGGGHVYYSKEALVKGLLFPTPEQKKNIKRNVNFFDIGFDADWEIDIFGATRHEVKALQAQSEAAQESLNDLWVTLSAEVARNYIELRSLQQRLRVLDHNLVSYKDTASLTQDLVDIGAANTSDSLLAKAQYSSLAAERSLLQLSIDKAIHRLAILLGYFPTELYDELSCPSPLPCLPDCLPIGIPSELLRRRPDIRKAERELAAATERIGAAVAALFPRLSLRGFIGDLSTQLPSLFTSGANTWFASPQLLLPIFNSKSMLQDVDLSKVQAQQACYNYQKVVMEAVEEAENAIAAFHYEQERNHLLFAAQEASQEAYALAYELYEKGLKSYIEVQSFNRSFLAAQQAFIESQSDLLMHYIALYKAFGGCWTDKLND